MTLRLRTATLDERGLTFLGRDGALTLGPDGVRLESSQSVQHTDRWLAPTGESLEPVVVPWPDVRELEILLPDTSVWWFRVLVVLSFFNVWETEAWFQRTTELTLRWRLQGLQADLGPSVGRPNPRGAARMMEQALAILGERELLPALGDPALVRALLSRLGGPVRRVPIVRGLVARRRAYRLALAWAETDAAGREALARARRPARVGEPPEDVALRRRAWWGLGLVLGGVAGAATVTETLVRDDGSNRPGVPWPLVDVPLGGSLLAMTAGLGLLLHVAGTAIAQRVRALRAPDPGTAANAPHPESRGPSGASAP